MENTILQNKLGEVKNIISELPHFTSDDTDKIIREINFIASGSRNIYNEQEQLESQLQTWGREFAKVLREKFNINSKNTNYSSWEYGKHDFSIDIFYVLSRLKEHAKINSEEDFCVTVSSWKTGNHSVLGIVKTPEEAIQILIENNLFDRDYIPSKITKVGYLNLSTGKYMWSKVLRKENNAFIMWNKTSGEFKESVMDVWRFSQKESIDFYDKRKLIKYIQSN